MKIKFLTAAVAAFLMLPIMATVAYAGGGEPEEIASVSVVQEAEPNPFTPDGTGTVVDEATDADGKEFYTITTPSDNVFYLIIDKQRTANNVYFLNAVTEADLLALAEPSESVSAIPDPEPPPAPVAPVDQEDDPAADLPAEPEKKSNTGTLVLVLLIVAGGGGAGYYFKVLRPKQQMADDGEDEFSEYEGDPYDFDGTDQDDDGPPWDVEEDDESEGEDE